MDTRRSLLAAVGASGVALVSGCLDLARGNDVKYEASPAAVGTATVEQEGFALENVQEPTIDRTIDLPVGGTRTVTVRNWAVQYAKSFGVAELGTAVLENNDIETITENVSEDTLEDAGVDTDQLDNGSVDDALDESDVSLEDVDTETLEEAGIDPKAVESGDVDPEKIESVTGQDGTDQTDGGDGQTDESDQSGGESTDADETGQSTTEQKKGVLFAAVSTPRAKVLGQDVNPAASFSNKELVKEVGKRFAKDKLDDISLVREGTETLLGSSETLSVFETEATIKEITVDVRIYLTKTTDGDDLVIAAGVHPAPIDEEAAIRTMINNVEHPTEPPKTPSQSG
jgi:hypothetical protein